jgi:SAM-dependent methyltransferase
MNSSEEYYNKIAENYRAISNNRSTYLDAIDNYIISHFEVKDSLKNFLDIGAGDGYRSMIISNGLKVQRTVLLDNSDGIVAGIKNDEKVETVVNSIIDFKTDEKFELITCLWNVLGHVGGLAERKEFFVRVEELLSDGGVFIFDVNNRLNIAHYGFKNVMNNLNMEHENNERTGWFTLLERGQKTDVYVHSPFDIDVYLAPLNLKVEKVEYVDYNTGEKKESFFEGQLLYYIKKKNA